VECVHVQAEEDACDEAYLLEVDAIADDIAECLTVCES
jgi:hypothetical protein